MVVLDVGVDDMDQTVEGRIAVEEVWCLLDIDL